MNKLFETPILLITFNRPNHTRQVWDAIKKQHPKNMFVFQDGARENNETDIEKCADVRLIFEEPLDWDCELKTFYSEVNLGCGPGPTAAITWFFENVEQGIIIEDDAVPATDFYMYAQELLHRYKNEEQIKVIGSMHLEGKSYGDGSYHYSMSNRNLCAWATWNRAWKQFDYNLVSITEKDLKQAMKKYKASYREIEYWCERLYEIHLNCLNHSSWDMQFLITIWLSKGIGIFPNVNLSTNIGFDNEATHTNSSVNIAANRVAKSILPLVHPKKINVDRKADLNYHKLYFQPFEYGFSGLKRWPFRLNKRIKKIVGIKGSWIKK